MKHELVVREDISNLIPENSICLELGVAEGHFSKCLLERTKNIKHLYSIDMWGGDRGHDINQYKRAICNLSNFKEKNTIIKLKFEDALSLFPDDFFDFIYVDGYAHTGEENGKTFFDWWPKLKQNGIFSGDDYDNKKWTEVYKNVNNFCEKKKLQINVIPNNMTSRSSKNLRTTGMDLSPTWFVFKI